MSHPSEWTSWAEQLAHATSAVVSTETALPLRVFVLGGSVSEVMGQRIGSAHNIDLGRLLLSAVRTVLPPSVCLAVQGCEHINRALVVERACQQRYGWPVVTVWPVPEAGGSLAAAAMEQLDNPVVVQSVIGQAGIDVGQTMIGMHLQPVVVPLRVEPRRVGMAYVTAGRSRPPLIGGPRAVYHNPQAEC